MWSTSHHAQARATSRERARVLAGTIIIPSKLHIRFLMNLQIYTSSLAETNSTLRTEEQEYERVLRSLDSRSRVMADLERERSLVENAVQEARALAYESSQFRVADLWATASAPRLKVFALRERVFGTGRRVGIRTAHGRFDRVQVGLNGRRQLVDALGRTEAEAAEEDELPHVLVPDEEEEVDVVPNPTMRPTWLLRFFHRWGARWSATKAAEDAVETEEPVVASPKIF
jgi:hypothetical protein